MTILKIWACHLIQPQKIRIWKYFGISGEMGLIPLKKWTPSLADECLSHRERGHDPPLYV